MNTKQFIEQYPGLKSYVRTCADPFDVLAGLVLRYPAADSTAQYERIRAMHDANLRRARWHKEYIENVLDQLEPCHRDVLYYHTIKGYSFFRTSAEMNYSERHVRRLHDQAVAAVKKCLAALPADQTK